MTLQTGQNFYGLHNNKQEKPPQVIMPFFTPEKDTGVAFLREEAGQDECCEKRCRWGKEWGAY
jgi:hypothetical protein